MTLLCKYRLDQTICTVKTCHLDGQNRPCSRSTIPLLFQTPRRSFSTAIAACRRKPVGKSGGGCRLPVSKKFRTIQVS